MHMRGPCAPPIGAIAQAAQDFADLSGASQSRVWSLDGASSNTSTCHSAYLILSAESRSATCRCECGQRSLSAGDCAQLQAAPLPQPSGNRTNRAPDSCILQRDQLRCCCCRRPTPDISPIIFFFLLPPFSIPHLPHQLPLHLPSRRLPPRS